MYSKRVGNVENLNPIKSALFPKEYVHVPTICPHLFLLIKASRDFNNNSTQNGDGNCKV